MMWAIWLCVGALLTIVVIGTLSTVDKIGPGLVPPPAPRWPNGYRAPSPPAALRDAQARVVGWVRSTFGEASSEDVPERALRFVEEAVELAQACGMPPEQLDRLVEYVYARPTGDASREVAGSMLTLYAVAAALGVLADEAFEKELERVQQPEVIARCRARQSEKRERLQRSPVLAYDPHLAAIAAARTAACPHDIFESTAGSDVCVLCGALRCDDGSWEPPIR